MQTIKSATKDKYIREVCLFDSDLIEDLQIEGVHSRWYGALNHFVPAWVLCPVVSCRRLIDGISESNPAVRVHARHTVVLC